MPAVTGTTAGQVVVVNRFAAVGLVGVQLTVGWFTTDTAAMHEVVV